MGRNGTWGWIPACGHDPKLNSALATSTWEKRSPLASTPPLVSRAREAFELEYGHSGVVGRIATTRLFRTTTTLEYEDARLQKHI
jgi:hypothetical protein